MNRKIFVGRCSEDITADDLRSYFSKFGEVVDVFIPKPFRAFAFVTFSDAEVAQNLCGEDHIMCGHSVHVSSAAPKNQNSMDRKGNYGYGGGQGNWGNQQGMGRQGMNNASAGNMGGNMGMNMGGFPINPAMVAAAQAALGQAGWGLLGMAQGGSGGNQGGNDSNMGGPGNNQNNYNQPPQGGQSNNNSGFLGGGGGSWNGPQGGGGGGDNQNNWGQQNKGNAWN